ncbi:hypothetical protein A1O1_04289 [Capronia coronata CBS 617.96]|uniref:Threonylcarbamoyl-AMP synthase n=1 Tax=Capronia coronata CBS 617.96 TaxID=1182541 RepID=W9YNC1_9EURO|nr:uncharacterized protein A1O1_04289 [Capronia coronata CBS 617.96]EXJ91180.1 hypothetical protein A1O1_04289 [Capronia coronata CBS 617.96]
MDTIQQNRRHLASMPYTNCDTRIVGLKDLHLPETASDEEYRQIYLHYIQDAATNPNASLLRDAIESIRHGIAPPVAFPTETVYGLGADATNEAAISGIFAAKGRPSDNPLIVHAASIAHLERLTGEPLPEIYRALAERFWPGPLTVLLPVPKTSRFAANVHPGQRTIGFRIPSSKYARFFIAATDRPIAGPSANSSGKPSPTTAQHVFDDLKGRINFILDAGPCDVGVESSVVDGLHDPPLILRPGGVSQSELIAHGREAGNRFAYTAIGYKRHKTSDSQNRSKDSNQDKYVVDDVDAAPRAPGMKYRHYAPRGRLVLFTEAAVAAGKVEAKFNDLVRTFLSSQGKDTAAVNGKGNGRVRLNVGIISCHWSAFAGLPVSSRSPISLTSSVASESIYAPITSVATYTFPPAFSSLDEDQSITFEDGRQARVEVQTTLYNVQIGPTITDLAHSLFGVLRLFDDLDCDFIFAETVRRGRDAIGTGETERTTHERVIPDAAANGSADPHANKQHQGHQDYLAESITQDIEDAVTDRIEKAAAERVDF